MVVSVSSHTTPLLSESKEGAKASIALLSGTSHATGAGMLFYQLAHYLHVQGFHVAYYGKHLTEAMRHEAPFKVCFLHEWETAHALTHVLYHDMAQYITARDSLYHLAKTLHAERETQHRKQRRWQKRLLHYQKALIQGLRTLKHWVVPYALPKQTLYSLHAQDTLPKGYLHAVDTVCSLPEYLAKQTGFPLVYAETLRPSQEKPEQVAAIVHSLCPENNIVETIHYALAQGMKKVVLHGALKDPRYYYTQIQPLIASHQASQKALPPEEQTSIHYGGFLAYPQARQALYAKISHIVSLKPLETLKLLQLECRATHTALLHPHTTHTTLPSMPCLGIEDTLTLSSLREALRVTWLSQLGLPL